MLWWRWMMTTMRCWHELPQTGTVHHDSVCWKRPRAAPAPAPAMATVRSGTSDSLALKGLALSIRMPCVVRIVILLCVRLLYRQRQKQKQIATQWLYPRTSQGTEWTSSRCCWCCRVSVCVWLCREQEPVRVRRRRAACAVMSTHRCCSGDLESSCKHYTTST